MLKPTAALRESLVGLAPCFRYDQKGSVTCTPGNKARREVVSLLSLKHSQHRRQWRACVFLDPGMQLVHGAHAPCEGARPASHISFQVSELFGIILWLLASDKKVK